MYKIELIEKLLDKKDEIINLLSQLSNTKYISNDELFYFLLNKPDNYLIYICIHTDNNKLVGIITVFIERKLIHNLGKVAHIEDLVVDKDERGKNVAEKLINKCVEYAKSENCYKIILNCSENLIKFYEKKNFFNSGYQMRMNI
tara:strand:+ start:173 stop:604 length:432 start_codon:yes stop_codon:yes gene_type:complete